MRKANRPQVGDECGRSGGYELRLGNTRRLIIAVVVGVSFPNRTSAPAFPSSPPAAPTGCPRGSPLQEHHVTTLTPASPRPGQKRGREPCGVAQGEGGRRGSPELECGDFQAPRRAGPGGLRQNEEQVSLNLFRFAGNSPCCSSY